MSNRSKVAVFYAGESGPERSFIGNSSGSLEHSKETKKRIELIRKGLSSFTGTLVYNEKEANDDEAIELRSKLNHIHDSDYLTYLRSSNTENRHDYIDSSAPYSAPGVAQDTIIESHSYNSAEAASLSCLRAATYLSKIENGYAYALCRPPGHHAGKSFLGGYCFLNNASVAALKLQESNHRPVCIIDVDYHAGNGTSDVLSSFLDISFVSIHAETTHNFPYLSDLKPSHPSHKYISLKGQPSYKTYIEALNEAILVAKNHGANSLVVSIGYDIVEGDPHGGWKLPTNIFKDIGKKLSETNLPICFVQEGGYLPDNLSLCSHFLLQGLMSQTNPIK